MTGDMPSYVSDIADAERWLDGWQARLSEKAALTRDFAERMAGLRAEARTPDGSVRVVVDSAGVPVQVELSRAVTGREPSRIAADIMATMRRAQAGLTQAATEAADETVGVESETGRALLDTYYTRFRIKPAEKRGDS